MSDLAFLSFKEFLNSTINESPFDMGKDVKFTDYWTKFNSDSSISRTSDFLVEIDNIRFFFKKDKSEVVGYIRDNDRTGNTSNRVVFELQFKSAPILSVGENVKNALFVDSVDIYPRISNRGISSAIYMILVKKGYTIISDNIQYTGGISLWKKIAKESNVLGFKVYIWDEKINGFISDKEGNPISYNSSNIEYSKIWKNNSRGYDIVLTLHPIVN